VPPGPTNSAFPFTDESSRREVKHETPVHLRVEAEIKVIQALVRITEAGLLAAPFQEPVRAARQFIGHEASN
jgi:hypothetical protein